MASLPISPGAGRNIHTELKGDATEDQYVRAARGITKSIPPLTPWAATTTGLINVIPADVTRVGLIILSATTGILYIRFDATIPVIATPAYDYFLNPGDRWEVPVEFGQYAQSWVSSVTGGFVLAVAALAA